MSAREPPGELEALVQQLVASPRETEWLEFKVDNDKPETIGQLISALANSVALAGRTNGYVVWGVRDGDRRVVGTSFVPADTRVGNEPLEPWLHRMCQPGLEFRFSELTLQEGRVVVLTVQPAPRRPVAFSGVEYIRVGSTTRKLKDFAEKERALWRAFDDVPFEAGVALGGLSEDGVLALLDHQSYFEMQQLPVPTATSTIVGALVADRLVVRSETGSWAITNLGAILFARGLSSFPALERKALRIIEYRGKGRTDAVVERSGTSGYAGGFAELMAAIQASLGSREVMTPALRRSLPTLPPVAVRELVANALIHQDFTARGAGPMVEIFEDRIEVTNPGEPLVAADRFLDSPPRSRNEALAGIARRLGICEERGSGIDRVVLHVELGQLPAPRFEVPSGFTRAILFAYRPLSQLERSERVWACYLHACLRYVSREALTNTSLRQRFGIEEQNRAMVSRLIREALDAGVIVAYDPDAAPRYKTYVPAWAVGEVRR